MPLTMPLIAYRLPNNPICDIRQQHQLGGNINGPSLIAAPAWLPKRHGRYYLYFAHHHGDHIRLATADDLSGPWHIHSQGVLSLPQTPLPLQKPDVAEPQWAVARGVSGLYPHIASPDVHIDHEQRQMRMYFHGLDHDGVQRSLSAYSYDGLDWTVHPRRINQTYLRVFTYQDITYALALGGQFMRQTDDGDFLLGGWAFPSGHRHAAVLLRGDQLHVIWTRIGDAPEKLLYSCIDLTRPWLDWTAESTCALLEPEQEWEGTDCPITASDIGIAKPRERALRDPCIFDSGTDVYVIYACAGESALGIAKLSGL